MVCCTRMFCHALNVLPCSECSAMETWHGNDHNAALANLRLKHMRSPFKWVFVAEQCQYLNSDGKGRPDSRRNNTVTADLGSKVRSGPSHSTDDLEPQRLPFPRPVGNMWQRYK